MSFLDERDDRPRRSSGARGRGRGGGGPETDSQTLLVRRLTAAGIGLLVLILLFVAVRGCMGARKERSFKDYGRDVSTLAEQSRQESEQLFGLLSDPGDQTPVDIENALNGFKSQAAQLVDRAREVDKPDEVSPAHRYLIQTLEFRRDGIGQIAGLLPRALGDEGRGEATGQIAGQMQNFLASDVLYSQRFAPAFETQLKEAELTGQVRVARSQFLPDIDWLSTDTVADRISRIRGGGADKAAKPGLHGTGVGTVTATPAGTALGAGGAVELQASEELAFDVQVQNQGENDETDVTVKLSVTGAGRPIEVEEKIDQIPAGGAETVSIPLAESPPVGREVTIDVEVEPVPGEKKADNNKQSFTVTFTK